MIVKIDCNKKIEIIFYFFNTNIQTSTLNKMSFIVIDHTFISTDPEEINTFSVLKLICNAKKLRIEKFITNLKNKNNNCDNYLLRLNAIQELYIIRLGGHPLADITRESERIDSERQAMVEDRKTEMTEFYKKKNKIMKACDKKTKAQKDKKAKWIHDKYTPLCVCPYVHRKIQGKTHMVCTICGKQDFYNELMMQQQNREQNINNGFYLRSETTDINIINSLPFDLSKQVVQYI